MDASDASKPREERGPRIKPGGGETLFNENQLLHLLRVEFARARRYRQALSCVLIALDRLEERADLWGTGGREALLSSVRDQVGRAIRISDFMGRYELDRILLVLPHTGLGGARLLATRLVETVAQEKVEIADQQVRVTLSVGISSSEKQDLLFHDALLEQAEGALLLAMDRGGNRVETLAPPEGD